jgi:hypothetical protein
MQQRDDRGTRRSLNLDPPVDVMPDYESGTLGGMSPQPALCPPLRKKWL